MKLAKSITFLLLVIFTFSCEDEIRQDLEDQVVIESFIFYGKQKNEIRVNLFSPLKPENAIRPITPNLTRITNLTTNQVLFPSQEEIGVYTFDSSVFHIEPGDMLNLLVQYQGIDVLANTIVPTQPTGAVLNRSNLKLNYLVDAVPERIILNWENNSNNDFFYIRIDTANNRNRPVNPNRMSEDPANLFINRLETPLNVNSLQITYPAVQYFGKHRILLYKIPKAYFDLYNNPVQGSYNKVNQSVVNGLGIFAALHADTIYFDVVE